MSSQYSELWSTNGWGRFTSLWTPANFNGFRVLAALLHGTPVVDISQTLRCWTEGATYIWQGSHHVGQRPTFLVVKYVLLIFARYKVSTRCYLYLFWWYFLWPPYAMSIIFLPCGFFFLSFILSFFISFFLSFFPCLFSAVPKWMSTILPHMMWP